MALPFSSYFESKNIEIHLCSKIILHKFLCTTIYILLHVTYVSLQNFEYELYAVINHKGGRNGGHYNAVIRPFEDNKWHCFDDDLVREVLYIS